MIKECTRCNEVKSFDDFYKQKDKKSGLRSHCKTCVTETSKHYTVLNKEARKAANASWYAANKKKHNARSATWALKNPAAVRANHIKYKYGQCVNYNEVMERYETVNRCECCNIEFNSIKGSRKCIDHLGDYIRGIICGNCNRGIGGLQDSLKGVKQALNYLERGK